MDLILWRHADAEAGAAARADDLERRLTPRGERQASRVALWLHRQLPDGLRVLVSPALRAQRTAAKLERPFATVESIGPGASARDLLAASGWPDARRTVLVVGHQPALGELVSLLLTGREAPWTIRKGSVWWLRSRPSDAGADGEARAQAFVVCVQSPETM
ncbi:MAG TPA: histidine phosphatase family protein [Burkholderiaceae bacterium]|nr:histidine phosphatase family protein [Burkholderiaceae bacterium]